MSLKDSKFFHEEQTAKTLAQDKVRDKHNQLLSDIKATFETAHGLRTLDWLLALCHVGTSVFTGNSQTFYKSGQQDIGNTIVNHILEADREIYPKLLQIKAENLKERNKANK